jgi:peptidoglycan/LPS O-acetylase OafA/YrhL
MSDEPHQTLGAAFQPDRNSFGFLRLLFAGMVLFAHACRLGSFGPDPLSDFSQGAQDFGKWGYHGFFALSGFLIARSESRSASLGVFLVNRLLRAAPGFWVCLFMVAFAFAPLALWLEQGSLDGLGALVPHSWHYLTSNFFFRIGEHHIGGLLKQLSFPNVFDGSLWSLEYGARCYLVIAGLGLLGGSQKRRGLVLGLTLALWILCRVDDVVPGRVLDGFTYVVVESAVFFFAGSCLFLFRDRIPYGDRPMLLCALALFVALNDGLFKVVGPFGLPYLVVSLGIALPLSAIGKSADYSYGICLYGFPIQQTLALAGVHQWGFWPYFAASAAITLVFAVVSFHLVERPALRLRGRADSALANLSWLRRYRQSSLP